MHGISTGCEGIPSREGQFRFTKYNPPPRPRAALIPGSFRRRLPFGAARNLFGLLYRRFIIVRVPFKGNGNVNVALVESAMLGRSQPRQSLPQFHSKQPNDEHRR